jgi:large subunit ribosomal protein L34
MSSKTLARAGSPLINRLFFSNGTSNPLRLHQIGSTSPFQSLLANLPIRESPRIEDLRIIDEETVKRLVSPSEVSFPCGLPSLRFFIEEGLFNFAFCVYLIRLVCGLSVLSNLHCISSLDFLFN